MKKLGLFRYISLLLGLALFFAPSFLLFSFAAMVGEPVNNGVFFYAPTLVIGFIQSAGLLLIGFPPKLAGTTTPGGRAFTGFLLLVSALSFLVIGFSGSVTMLVSPLVLAFEAVIFYLFVFPATLVVPAHSNG